MSFPTIQRHDLDPAHRDFIEAWSISDEAEVLPPMEAGQRSIALWHGQYNSHDETPVFAVPFSTPNLKTVNGLSDWYYGIAKRADIPDGNAALDAYLNAAINSAKRLEYVLGALVLMAPTQQLQPTG